MRILRESDRQRHLRALDKFKARTPGTPEEANRLQLVIQAYTRLYVR